MIVNVTTVTQLSRREKIAVVASAAILLASAIYWVVQIVDVIELLRMAYG